VLFFNTQEHDATFRTEHVGKTLEPFVFGIALRISLAVVTCINV